jgi:hypothetical protein
MMVLHTPERQANTPDVSVFSLHGSSTALLLMMLFFTPIINKRKATFQSYPASTFPRDAQRDVTYSVPPCSYLSLKFLSGEQLGKDETYFSDARQALAPVSRNWQRGDHVPLFVPSLPTLYGSSVAR